MGMSDREAEVRARAHGFWERDGCPDGRAEEHWRRAEMELMAEENARQVPQAGGPEDEPRIWGVAEAAAQGRPVREAVPANDPAEIATNAGRRA